MNIEKLTKCIRECLRNSQKFSSEDNVAPQKIFGNVQ